MRKVWGTAIFVWSCYCVALACFFGLLASARVAEQFAEPGTLDWGYALITGMAAVVALTYGLSRLIEYAAVRWVFPRLFAKSLNVTCHEPEIAVGCPACVDEDGGALYPCYGVGPHRCFYKIPGAQVGQSEPLPREEWPANYIEDAECPGMGTYWCPACGHGKPEQRNVTCHEGGK